MSAVEVFGIAFGVFMGLPLLYVIALAIDGRKPRWMRERDREWPHEGAESTEEEG